MRRVLLWLGLGLVTVLAALVILVLTLPPLDRPASTGSPAPPAPDASAPSPRAAAPSFLTLPSFIPLPRPWGGRAAGQTACGQAGPPGAAAANAASLRTSTWSALRRQEIGWEIYAPKIAADIGAVGCAPDSEGFAAALARWQAGHKLLADGRLDEPTLKAMNLVWNLQRPFAVVSARGVCPASPPAEGLAWARPEEGYSRKPIQLRPAALEAYRRMVADARAADPAIAADKQALTIFSGFRPSADDDVRCAADGNCQGVTRTTCSAHRTGLALDIVVGAAPGQRVDSSDDANRLAMSRSPTYRWLVANAGRYGFVNYVFEPWHWEWTGEGFL